MRIKTNNVPRLLLYGYELSIKEREEFDYISEDDFANRAFAKYKGQLYDTHEFCTTRGMPEDSPLRTWDGYMGDSFFSGVLVRFTHDNDRVIMATYID